MDRVRFELRARSPNIHMTGEMLGTLQCSTLTFAGTAGDYSVEAHPTHTLGTRRWHTAGLMHSKAQEAGLRPSGRQ